MAALTAAYHWFFASHLECWAFLVNLLGVWLMTRQWLIAWPVGLVGVALYAVIFVQYHLFADAALQLFFAAVLVYGWWHWLHPQPGRRELPVTRLAPAGRRACVLGCAAGLVLIGLLNYALRARLGLLARPEDYAITFFDSLTTAMSLVAQWLQARKKLANWPWWIATNVLYVGLYLAKDLRATAVLFVLFIVLAVLGWRAWGRSLAAAEQQALQPA